MNPLKCEKKKASFNIDEWKEMKKKEKVENFVWSNKKNATESSVEGEKIDSDNKEREDQDIIP